MPTPALPPPGTVTTLARNEELWVRLSGELDLSLRPQLEALIPEVVEYRGRVIVDARSVTFCDGTLPAFLAALVGRKQVDLLAPTRLVREVLTLYATT
jgi:hypothetical protein